MRRKRSVGGEFSEVPGGGDLSVIYRRDPEALKRLLTRALFDQAGDVSATARALDITRPYLWFWLRRLEMRTIPAAIRAERGQHFRLFPDRKTSSCRTTNAA